MKVVTLMRGLGDSAIVRQAYLERRKVRDPETQIIYDFRRRSGGKILGRFFHQPNGVVTDHAPDEFTLHMEARERCWDSWVAREFRLSLPHELSVDQLRDLLSDIGREVSRVLATPVLSVLHPPPPDGNPLNVHAHLLLGTRRITGSKMRVWDKKYTAGAEITALRKVILQCINQALEKAGIAKRWMNKRELDKAAESEPHIQLNPKMWATKRSWEKKCDTLIEDAQELSHVIAPRAWIKQIRDHPEKAKPGDKARLALAAKAATALDHENARGRMLRELILMIELKAAPAIPEASIRRDVLNASTRTRETLQQLARRGGKPTNSTERNALKNAQLAGVEKTAASLTPAWSTGTQAENTAPHKDQTRASLAEPEPNL